MEEDEKISHLHHPFIHRCKMLIPLENLPQKPHQFNDDPFFYSSLNTNNNNNNSNNFVIIIYFHCLNQYSLSA